MDLDRAFHLGARRGVPSSRCGNNETIILLTRNNKQAPLFVDSLPALGYHAALYEHSPGRLPGINCGPIHMAPNDAVNEVAGKYWDQQLENLKNRTVSRTRWWDDDTTKRHVNTLVGDSLSTEMHFAFHQRIMNFFDGKRNIKALSVGCGAATKEMWLMKMIDVERFDLFDISSESILLGKEEASRQNIIGKLNFRVEDAFSASLDSDYDLVYWNNSLHHMPDVKSAIQWSRDRLKRGGLFAMDDFVGPNRFQWTDSNLQWSKRVRTNLPERFLENPYASGAFLPKEVARSTIAEMIATDPSEAVDSGRILDCLKTIFPGVEIIPTGGALYHLALNDIFCNFNTDDELAMLRQILLLDQALAEHGLTQYAVAFGVKCGNQFPGRNLLGRIRSLFNRR
jgi:SAM-dependent methyltransferase